MVQQTHVRKCVAVRLATNCSSGRPELPRSCILAFPACPCFPPAAPRSPTLRAPSPSVAQPKVGACTCKIPQPLFLSRSLNHGGVDAEGRQTGEQPPIPSRSLSSSSFWMRCFPPPFSRHQLRIRVIGDKSTSKETMKKACVPSSNNTKKRWIAVGFKEVCEEDKSKLVGNVFSNVASNYDIMNDMMSVGLHRLWKDRLVYKLNPFPGMKHLDVAGGTGDVAFRVLESINSISHRAMQDGLVDNEDETRIYVCDINPNMLSVGKKRAIERGLGEDPSLCWVEGDAEALSFEDGSMDGYTIAFGIRNVTHIEKVLKEAYRVLRRGGRFLCLELSHVELPVFKQLYDYYSFSIIPAMGELVAGDRGSYQYLVESIRQFPKQETFARMIADTGFQKVEYENLVGGVVSIHSGLKL